VNLEALGRRGGEKGCDLAPKTGLVLLHSQHEVGPAARDRDRDSGITSNGVDGHERALERAGGGEPLQEHRDRSLLAQLVRDSFLTEHKALVGREG
jgi:hypothetical protein